MKSAIEYNTHLNAQLALCKVNLSNQAEGTAKSLLRNTAYEALVGINVSYRNVLKHIARLSHIKAMHSYAIVVQSQWEQHNRLIDINELFVNSTGASVGISNKINLQNCKVSITEVVDALKVRNS